MAVINRNSLVLDRVNVVRDVLAGTMGFGLNQAMAQPPASLHQTRHSSHSYPRTESESGSWHGHARCAGIDQATTRAGRPGCCPGVLASRSPANYAGRIIPAEWSLAIGGACRTAAWPLDRFAIESLASVGKVLSGSIQLLRTSLPRPSSRWGLALAKHARKHARAGQADIKPAGWTLSASTRG